MKVGIFLNTDGACDWYRAKLPMQTAEINGAAKTSSIWMANLLYEVSNESKKFLDCMTSDIYLIQRLSGLSLIKRIKTFANEIGINPKIIIDHDDDVFNVSPLSNHYVDFGTEEIKIVHNGKLIHEWKDGINIDIKTNQKRIDEVKSTLEQVDMVTVTTEKLANVFKPYNQNVVVLPNCVDLNQWNKLDVKRTNKDDIRICWAGGHSHWEDLHMIRRPLIEIARKNPNVKIIMLGYMPTSMASDFRSGQIEFHRWVETPAHPYRLAALDVDIAVIPLKDNEFNKSKSPIKWIEFSSLKIPSVTSYISPYKEVADLENGENGIFIEQNSHEGWLEGLELLVNNAALRKEIGDKARKTVEQHFDMNTQYHQWVSAYKGVLSGNPIKSAIN